MHRHVSTLSKPELPNVLVLRAAVAFTFGHNLLRYLLWHRTQNVC